MRIRTVVAALVGGLLVLAVAAPAGAQELTAVQIAFVDHQPLTFLDGPSDPSVNPSLRVTPPPARVAPGAVDTPALEFKPARLGKVFFHGFELLFIEHVVRLATEQKTRSALKGPFFSDWMESIHVPKKWGDEDPWELNYIGHAIHGSAAARIWLDQRERPATTRTQYLQSMGRALIFATIFSELFENGPLSEASIGNVARRQELTGWSDHVWTPIGGVLWTMAEDAIDKYAVTRLERHVSSGVGRVAIRMALNPGRMLANVAENRVPWYRADRPMPFAMTARR